MKRPRILTIAGSDSSGGAGIQADLKTFAAHGCYGMSVITAVTAQNTLGVSDVVDLPPRSVTLQLQAVLSDVGCDAAKTGMLSNSEIVEAVYNCLMAHHIKRLVVDPVMVSKSGAALLSPEAVEALKTLIFPLSQLITPNLDEVSAILGSRPRSVQEMEAACRELSTLGPKAVLVKGGHMKEAGTITDVLWTGETFEHFSSPRLETKHTHGTGCTLSAAIAANLGHGMTLVEAVRRAKEYLLGALRNAYPLGTGIGPVDHLWRMDV